MHVSKYLSMFVTEKILALKLDDHHFVINELQKQTLGNSQSRFDSLAM